MSHHTYAELGSLLVQDHWGLGGDSDSDKKIKNASCEQKIVFLLAAILEDSCKLSLSLCNNYQGLPIIRDPLTQMLLWDHSVKYVCQLANMTRRQILRIYGIGPARLAQIEEDLARLGLVLAGD